MTNCNILILSAGRRVELVNLFKKSLKNLNMTGNVVATDFNKTAPALYFADKNYIVPKVKDDNFLDSLLHICKNEEISLIVPTIDTELLLMAKNRKYIENSSNAIIMISDYTTIDICRDKIKSQLFFEENNFGTPKLYTQEEIEKENVNFPAFIKPKSGSSSQNVYKVNDIQELRNYIQIVPDYIVQEFVSGEEYTIDVFNDFRGNVITVVPRLRMATRSGEISKGKIVRDPVIIEDIKRLMSVLKSKGHVTVQLMKTDDGLKYIEINPRFGGGAPMSIESGADSCTNLLKLLQGEELEYNEDFKENLIFLRYDSSICLNDHLEDLND